MPLHAVHQSQLSAGGQNLCRRRAFSGEFANDGVGILLDVGRGPGKRLAGCSQRLHQVLACRDVMGVGAEPLPDRVQVPEVTGEVGTQGR